MNNIHAPTVPSGPTSNTTSNGHLVRLTFAELQRKKDDVEAELKALGAVLDSVRRSVLYTFRLIRTTRARIIHLRNDYKDLMAMIEKHLHEHFASLQEEDEPEAQLSRNAGLLADHSASRPREEPFAKVNTVVPGSPAEAAGLKPDDEIRNFGYVKRSNHDNLKKVAECVQGNEGSQATGLGYSIEAYFRQPAGIAAYINSKAQLGWQRFTGLSYPASVMMTGCFGYVVSSSRY
ncbi:26S proteasome non-ATPase regulatory subunit 9 [Colletotrichum spaethianum]|uniref:26S proteasome non-ATPase regulatory subunit 9 n=1 Tax=Colletotrichum spaethianum TaxID=700344 RepID=A0AA37PA19_9PEZI|nr:26S proteasome non-ATPase regulatory subunit 9 [Colletotrichum spaethianum]GKT48386.1 26S proteasome non-ATPase regulatory subunit 9 [Colletotrichum spaethianum]